jgi:hypothetical protein
MLHSDTITLVPKEPFAKSILYQTASKKSMNIQTLRHIHGNSMVMTWEMTWDWLSQRLTRAKVLWYYMEGVE